MSDERSVADKLAEWFDRLPDGGMGKEHFDALLAIAAPAPSPEHPLRDRGEGENRMCKISELVAELQETQKRFGDSCVYIRRGGLAWGAVALNRQADDKKHGVFDLQAAHDRAMSERLGQVERLIADRNEWRDRAVKAEAAALQPQVGK